MPLLEAARIGDDPSAFDVLAVTYKDFRRDALQLHRPPRCDLSRRCSTPTEPSPAATACSGIPQTWFIDADGVVRDRVYGITSKRCARRTARRAAPTVRRRASASLFPAEAAGREQAAPRRPTRRARRARPSGTAAVVSTARTVSESAAAGSSLAIASSAAGQLVERVRHAAEEQQHEEQRVRRGEVRLGAQRAGHEQSDAGERDRAEQAAGRARGRRPPVTSQPSASPVDDDQRRTARLRAASTVAVLATSSPPRESGVDPSRFSTP